MLPGDSASLRKARGAFFTPETVARFVIDWAVQTPDDSVLEPSCGEAVFLHAVGDAHRGPLHGVELHAASAVEAERTLASAGISATIELGDFFEVEPTHSFSAVVGNPPYVRYQDFAGSNRARSREAALRAGVSLTGLASSWAPFTVHSAMFLRQGGRLGLVLPAELLTVNYAADVRRFLMQHFSSVRLVMFVERVFPGVLEEVVLLLADGFDRDGRTGTDHCEIYQVRNADALDGFSDVTRWAPSSPGAKWSASMVPPAALEVYSALTNGWEFAVLEEWGDTTLGMVTGNNKYFTLAPAHAAELGLTSKDLVPLSPPGSRHLRGLSLSKRQLRELGEAGSATYLFRPHGTPSAAAQRYITAGEATNVDKAYKCRVRKPWWKVPDVRPADLLLTYMNSVAPQMVTNDAGVRHLNSVHGVYLRDATRVLGRDLLPLAALNSVSLLGAETVGRAYGGGMLKIEPREADQWPMPSPQLVEKLASELRGVKSGVGKSLKNGRLLDAVCMVDEVLFSGMGVPADVVDTLRAAREELAARRAARGKES